MTQLTPVILVSAMARGTSGSRARNSSAREVRGARGRLAATTVMGLVLFAASLVSAGVARAEHPARASAERRTAALGDRYATLLTRHRPDLAERYGVTVPRVPFVALDAAKLPLHEQTLRALLAEAQALPASPGADSLRARIVAELAQSDDDGALRRDALLWLDIVAAAARAPYLSGRASACSRVAHAQRQLRRIPEALRSAAVLTAGHEPDAVAFEMRVATVEAFLRHDLPARTEPCKESRRRGEFVEADSLAAASLASFRRWVLKTH